MIELVYPDGTTEMVERCFRVEAKTKKGWVLRWVAQRKPGSPLKRFKPENLKSVQPAAELPESWRPPPRRLG